MYVIVSRHADIIGVNYLRAVISMRHIFYVCITQGRTNSGGIYGFVYSFIGGFAHGIRQDIGSIGGYRGGYARRARLYDGKRGDLHKICRIGKRLNAQRVICVHVIHGTAIHTHGSRVTSGQRRAHIVYFFGASSFSGASTQCRAGNYSCVFGGGVRVVGVHVIPLSGPLACYDDTAILLLCGGGG